MTPTVQQWVLHSIAILVLLSAPALAQDGARQAGGDTFVQADHAEALQDPWSVTMEQLEANHSAVARAMATPGDPVQVTDDERPDVNAFFDRLSEHDGVEVDGQAWTVRLMMHETVHDPDASVSKPVNETNEPVHTDRPAGLVVEVWPFSDPPESVWTLRYDTVEETYPPVARALVQPGILTSIHENETQAWGTFWEGFQDFDALQVNGTHYLVSVPEGPAAGGPVEPTVDPAGNDSESMDRAPGPGVLGLTAALAGAMLVARRRR